MRRSALVFAVLLAACSKAPRDEDPPSGAGADLGVAADSAPTADAAAGEDGSVDLADAGSGSDEDTGSPTGDATWEPVRLAIEASALTDLTVQVGTTDGVQLTYSKGNSSPSTSYLVASASKWLSSAVFMSLVEAGLLSLDDHPQDHLSWWTADPLDARSRITLAQLLSFTSGLPRDEACPMMTTTECAQHIHDVAAGNTEEPGTIFAYGGSHMQVAGAMAVAASGGMNWSELFRAHVGDPLGMSAGAGFRPNPQIAGGASLNLEDYAKFLSAIFARTLVAASLEAMETDHTPAGTVAIAYSPLGPTGYEWHYGLGHWRECYQPAWDAACDQHVRVSSPGAFGFYPLIDRDAAIPYWVIIARQDGGGQSGAASVNLGATLTPLIETALGIR